MPENSEEWTPEPGEWKADVDGVVFFSAPIEGAGLYSVSGRCFNCLEYHEEILITSDHGQLVCPDCGAVMLTISTR